MALSQKSFERAQGIQHLAGWDPKEMLKVFAKDRIEGKSPANIPANIVSRADHWAKAYSAIVIDNVKWQEYLKQGSSTTTTEAWKRVQKLLK